jgi:hypothetical protein
MEAVKASLFKVFFVDGKKSRGRPKISWKEAVDKDSITLGNGNRQSIACDRASYWRQLRNVMNHN